MHKYIISTFFTFAILFSDASLDISTSLSTSNEVADPMQDAAFKKLIADNDIAISIINAFLHGMEKVTSIESRSVTIPGKDIGIIRNPSMDFHCITNNGKHIVIEMQRISNKLFSTRAFFYAAYAFTHQFDEKYFDTNKTWDASIKPTYSIQFIAREHARIDNPDTNQSCIRMFKMRDESGIPLDAIGIHVIQVFLLRNLVNIPEDATKWIEFFRNPISAEKKYPQENILQRALNNLYLSNWNSNDRNKYNQDVADSNRFNDDVELFNESVKEEKNKIEIQKRELDSKKRELDSKKQELESKKQELESQKQQLVMEKQLLEEQKKQSKCELISDAYYDFIENAGISSSVVRILKREFTQNDDIDNLLLDQQYQEKRAEFSDAVRDAISQNN